ncbi:MAG: hypothetical protein U5K69_27040 [Balneolaceae bacterium]|nr:hypothetical protein [Balneolaceae bacterium]
MTFTQGLENSNTAIFIHDTENQQTRQATSGFYNDAEPVFSADGKYLFS